MRITSKQGQWLGDVAVREAGDLLSIVEMAVSNDISVTENMIIGSELVKPKAINRRVMNYYEINNIYPATAMEREPGTLGGIGYMAVGITFIVS
jgi:hypothetical protein